jgi:hypothetical protein
LNSGLVEKTTPNLSFQSFAIVVAFYLWILL